MKKLGLIIVSILACSGLLKAQETEPVSKMKVYCEVMCVQYNLFKDDVNAIVDFGIADKANNANGWIYNSETNKKYSFASPMSVFKYMSERGWEYKDAIVVTESSGMKANQNVWHFILMKEMPVGCTADEIIGNIDYRNK